MRIWFSKDRSGLFINVEHSNGRSSRNLGYTPYFIIRLIWRKCPIFGIDGWWWNKKMEQLKEMLSWGSQYVGTSKRLVLPV